MRMQQSHPRTSASTPASRGIQVRTPSLQSTTGLSQLCEVLQDLMGSECHRSVKEVLQNKLSCYGCPPHATYDVRSNLVGPFVKS